MGTTYDFIAINEISYEKAVEDALTALGEDNMADALQILQQMKLRLQAKKPCAKDSEEVGTT